MTTSAILDSDGRPERYHGHAHLPDSQTSVCVAVAHTGRILYESFNRCDQRGERSFRSLSPEALDREPLLAARAQARASTRESATFARGRRRDTAHADLRYAWLASWGRGGHTIHIQQTPDQQCRLSGYGLSPGELAEIRRLGIPYIDTRPVPDTLAYRMVGLPMVSLTPEPPPWGSLSYAPLPVYAAADAALGAAVENVELDTSALSLIRSFKTHLRAWAAWVQGDQQALFTAMNEGLESAP